MAYLTDWKQSSNSHYCCSKCKSKNCVYRIWETFDECHQDFENKCLDCGFIWWVDGPDY